MIYDTLEEPTRSHDAAKRKVSFFPFHEKFADNGSWQALIRDGYRCVVSNHYDFTSVEQSQDLTDRVIANDLRTVSTNCAHIFPASTNLSIEVGSDKVYPSLLLSFITLDEIYINIALLCCLTVDGYATL